MLLDRAFFNVSVVEFLQEQNLPFVMPAMFRGRKPKRGKPTGLHAIKRKRAGWHRHTMKNEKRESAVPI